MVVFHSRKIQWNLSRVVILRVHSYWRSYIASRWIHRQSNLMFILNSDKDHRKNSLSSSVNEP